MRPRRIAVIGAGITGAAAAHALVADPARAEIDEIVLFERAVRIGGRIAATPFAGVEAVDTAADAFLARVPEAVELAVAVGLGEQLVHPEPVGAAVWFDRMHDIPDGLVLGVPGNPRSLARSRLISWRGKARAAVEPLLPRSSIDHDSLGRYVRARVGDEVHERLVDALVGSIYAADTDRFSLAEIPQLATLAGERSLLLAARRTARRTTGTASAAAAPIFAAPRGGMPQLVRATVDAFSRLGGELRLGHDVTVEPADRGWRVGDDEFDAVICTAPADRAAHLLRGWPASARRADRADVALVTLLVPGEEFPDRCRGRSGYLVPKPAQRHVTAVSFGSQKWAHWAPPGGGEILRASLGHDGATPLHFGDDDLIVRVLDDLRRHLGVSFTPREVRVSRWPGAFAQYRPRHRAWVDSVRHALAPGLYVAGSSYDGIGIPACVRSATVVADAASRWVDDLAT